MPKPRIWVSDGGVTGKYEDASFALTYDAMRKVQTNDIKHVLSIGDCIRLVNRLYKGEVGSARNAGKRYQYMGKGKSRR